MPHSTSQLVSGPDLTVRQLHDLLELRVNVFVVEQQCAYAEVDGLDLEPTTEHLWRSDDDGITVALRVLSDPEGRRIGRVVTRPDQRGHGLAGQLIEDAIANAAEATTVLSAQSHLESFYASHGYQVAGPEFIEDGIPHIPMRRPPSATSPT